MFTLDKEAKRAAKEAKIQARFEEDREERERALMDVRDSHKTLGNVPTSDRNQEGGRRQLTGAQQTTRKAQRSRFQFEASHSDDEVEDELDDNLGEIGEAAKRLKSLGISMGKELDTQNQRIDRISDKASAVDNQMFRNTEKVSVLPYLSTSLYLPLLVAQAHQVIRLFTMIPDIQKGFSPPWVTVDYYGLEYLSTILFCTIYKGGYSSQTTGFLNRGDLFQHPPAWSQIMAVSSTNKKSRTLCISCLIIACGRSFLRSLSL